jgi:hypothetical protein
MIWLQQIASKHAIFDINYVAGAQAPELLKMTTNHYEHHWT